MLQRRKKLKSKSKIEDFASEKIIRYPSNHLEIMFVIIIEFFGSLLRKLREELVNSFCDAWSFSKLNQAWNQITEVELSLSKSLIHTISIPQGRDITKILIKLIYLCPVVSVLELRHPEFLKATIEKREKTEKMGNGTTHL